MTTALILFAHGARDPEWAGPLRRVREQIQRSAVVPVELAFLEFMVPDLPTCAETLIASGARRIVVLPMFIARGGHLKRELPAMLEVLRRQHPEIEFGLQDAVGEQDAVIEAMARVALRATGIGQ